MENVKKYKILKELFMISTSYLYISFLCFSLTSSKVPDSWAQVL